jgi:hypothetical protein
MACTPVMGSEDAIVRRTSGHQPEGDPRASNANPRFAVLEVMWLKWKLILVSLHFQAPLVVEFVAQRRYQPRPNAGA